MTSSARRVRAALPRDRASAAIRSRRLTRRDSATSGVVAASSGRTLLSTRRTFRAASSRNGIGTEPCRPVGGASSSRVKSVSTGSSSESPWPAESVANSGPVWVPAVSSTRKRKLARSTMASASVSSSTRLRTATRPTLGFRGGCRRHGPDSTSRRAASWGRWRRRRPPPTRVCSTRRPPLRVSPGSTATSAVVKPAAGTATAGLRLKRTMSRSPSLASSTFSPPTAVFDCALVAEPAASPCDAGCRPGCKPISSAALVVVLAASTGGQRQGDEGADDEGPAAAGRSQEVLLDPFPRYARRRSTFSTRGPGAAPTVLRVRGGPRGCGRAPRFDRRPRTGRAWRTRQRRRPCRRPTSRPGP